MNGTTEEGMLWIKAQAARQIADQGYIHRFHRQLVGIHFKSKSGVDRATLWYSLARSMQVLLAPEPDNVQDRNAILVYRADDPTNDLGYVDYQGAQEICRLMECGADFKAQIAWIENAGKPWMEVHMDIFQLTLPVRTRRPSRKNAPKYDPYETPQVISESSIKPDHDSLATNPNQELRPPQPTTAKAARKPWWRRLLAL